MIPQKGFMVNLHGEKTAHRAPHRTSELGGSEKFRQGPTNPLPLLVHGYISPFLLIPFSFDH